MKSADEIPMSSSSHPLIGAWRIVSCEHRLSNGSVTRPFGRKPKGRLVYTADGRMIVLLTAANRPLCDSGQLFEARDEELATAMRGVVAYSGRWRAHGDQVRHQVEISLFPNWVGTVQVRAFKLRGRRVSLTTKPFNVRGVKQTACLVWEREQ